MYLRWAAPSLLTALAFSQEVKTDPSQTIPLIVPAGVPLRLYLTKRVSKRAEAPVEAKLLSPVYTFDREVIPAGTLAIGHVSHIQSVSKWERTRAILGGDFTPLHLAQVEFTSLTLPDGRVLNPHTAASQGLNSLVPLRPKKQRSPNPSNGGVIATGKQKARDQVDAQIDRIKSIPDIVRGPNKMEWLTDFLMAKLPYHPQYIKGRTRFDAELVDPLDFGTTTVTNESLALLGSPPPTGSKVHARLLNSLGSKVSGPGDKVEAVLDQPLFSADHKLILPEGTRVAGTVASAKPAGWFHHGGRLRFSFQSVDIPQLPLLQASRQTVPSPPQQRTLQFRTQGTLSAAESSNAPVKVDEEGGVHATESKTRFIGALVSVLIARRAGDNDVEHSSTGAVTGQSSNIGGRTLGGGMGFGLLGSIAAQSSRSVGTALGYYGMAWSLYSTIVARGAEVEFNKNAIVDINFNTRIPGSGTKSATGPVPPVK
jgi:hypothetical protein